MILKNGKRLDGMGDSMPIGSIVEYNGTDIPDGWEILPGDANVYIGPTKPTEGQEVWIKRNENLWDKNYFLPAYTIDAETGIEREFLTTGCGTNYIEVKPNTDYVFKASQTLAALRLSEYNQDKNHIQRQGTNESDALIIRTSPTTKFLRWSFNYNDANTVTSNTLDGINLYLTEGIVEIYVKDANNQYEKITSDSQAVERGENIEGNTHATWTKYADGRMEITKRVSGSADVTTAWGSIYTSNNISLGDYPVAFVDRPIVNISSVTATDSQYILTAINLSTNTDDNINIGTVCILRPNSRAGTPYIFDITATGRWK